MIHLFTEIFLFQAARLESQAKRFQTDAERAEKSEEGLRTERDRLQKEVTKMIVIYQFYN